MKFVLRLDVSPRHRTASLALVSQNRLRPAITEAIERGLSS